MSQLSKTIQQDSDVLLETFDLPLQNSQATQNREPRVQGMGTRKSVNIWCSAKHLQVNPQQKLYQQTKKKKKWKCYDQP